MNKRNTITRDGETWEKGRVSMILVHEATGIPVHKGAQVKTFRGEDCTLEGGDAPHKPSSTGRVYVRFPGSERANSFFPGVIGCEWRPIE